jgi:hypothetical protein
MAAEGELKPGWLIRDVRKASDRIAEWTKVKSQATTSINRSNQPGSTTEPNKADHRPKTRDTK